MKRRPNYFEKGLKIAIVVLFIAVIAIAAINLYTTGTTQIQILGVSLEVPDDGGFDLESKYNVYSSYIGKDNGWGVTAINVANVNTTDSKQNTTLNNFNKAKNIDVLGNNKDTVEGIQIYKTGSGVVSYFKVNSIDFKVYGDEDTVVSIVNSIKELNKGSTITFVNF